MEDQEEFVLKRDQCSYTFKKGASKGTRCERMIPIDVGGFCKSHRKIERVIPSVLTPPPQPPPSKKIFNELPTKKELEDEVEDEDTEIIQLPSPEEEEEEFEEVLEGEERRGK